VWQRHSFAALSAISAFPAVSTIPALPAVSVEQLLLRTGALRVQEGRAAVTAPYCTDAASRAAVFELVLVEQRVSAASTQVAYEQQ